MLRLCLILSSLLVLFPTNAAQRDNNSCGIIAGQSLTNAYGPWDYTNPNHQDKLPIVIGAHFSRQVASLTKGITGITPHGDIDYTLRAIPNHHHALWSAAKLEAKDKLRLTNGDTFSPRYYTANCYFKRAIYFQPKDHVTRMLYAMFLQKSSDYKQALEQYNIALSIQPKDPEVNYNLGLLYVEIKQLEKAEAHAKIAYAAGHPLLGLKNKVSKLKSSLH